jgi:hypothetical protein
VTRIAASRKRVISRRHEIRFLLLLTIGLCVPILSTVIAIVATTEPDISDLTPAFQTAGEYHMVNWSELERGRPHALQEGSTAFTGAQVQALGYMMEGGQPLRAGDWVPEFVLLPDAGNLLHPAHRFGDQMIAVHLAARGRIQFAPRKLVWVWGTFRASPGNPAGAKPLYDLDRARVLPAGRTDIQKYFR